MNILRPILWTDQWYFVWMTTVRKFYISVWCWCYKSTWCLVLLLLVLLQWRGCSWGWLTLHWRWLALTPHSASLLSAGHQRLGEAGQEVIAPPPGAASSTKMHSRPLLKTIRSSESEQIQLIQARLSQQHKQHIFWVTSHSVQTLEAKIQEKEEEVEASKLYLIEAANNPGLRFNIWQISSELLWWLLGLG